MNFRAGYLTKCFKRGALSGLLATTAAITGFVPERAEAQTVSIAQDNVYQARAEKDRASANNTLISSQSSLRNSRGRYTNLQVQAYNNMYIRTYNAKMAQIDVDLERNLYGSASIGTQALAYNTRAQADVASAYNTMVQGQEGLRNSSLNPMERQSRYALFGSNYDAAVAGIELKRVNNLTRIGVEPGVLSDSGVPNGACDLGGGVILPNIGSQIIHQVLPNHGGGNGGFAAGVITGMIVDEVFGDNDRNHHRHTPQRTMCPPPSYNNHHHSGGNNRPTTTNRTTTINVDLDLNIQRPNTTTHRDSGSSHRVTSDRSSRPSVRSESGTSVRRSESGRSATTVRRDSGTTVRRSEGASSRGSGRAPAVHTDRGGRGQTPRR